MSYRGIDGFLGTRASIMLDIVFLAMFAILPVLFWSIYLVRSKQMYAWHKRIQVCLGLVLLIAVALFEIDMRFVSGWRDRAMPSPYYGPIHDAPPIIATIFRDLLKLPEVPGAVFQALGIHLIFATTTAVLWVIVISRALLNFPCPPVPGPHSRSHRFWGWIAAWDMLGTSVTGWVFYYLAFAA